MCQPTVVSRCLFGRGWMQWQGEYWALQHFFRKKSLLSNPVLLFLLHQDLAKLYPSLLQEPDCRYVAASFQFLRSILNWLLAREVLWPACMQGRCSAQFISLFLSGLQVAWNTLVSAQPKLSVWMRFCCLCPITNFKSYSHDKQNFIR